MFKSAKEKTTREEALLQLMEQAKDAVAVLTGIKAQFIENGWSDVGAEQAVIVLLQQNIGNRVD
jgi:hypothetical protein